MGQAVTAMIDSMKDRLQALETLQEAMVSVSKGALEQMNLAFGIATGFFAVFFIFFGYRQIMSDRSRDTSDVEMRGLVGAFQNNISSISSLILTLEKSFEYRAEVQGELDRLRGGLQIIETSTKQTSDVSNAVVENLNREAVALFDADVDRKNLGREDVTRQLSAFSEKVMSVAAIRNVEGMLNPFAHYLRGLHHVSNYEYQLADQCFALAQSSGSGQARAPSEDLYAREHFARIPSLTEKLLILCSYFRGVGYKNTGKYKKSLEQFSNAIELDPLHTQSRTYLLQVMFFDGSIAMPEVEQAFAGEFDEYERMVREKLLPKDRLSKYYSTLKLFEGNMYFHKWIPRAERAIYVDHEDKVKAAECYWEAYSSRPNEMTAFALAQALEWVDLVYHRSESPQSLYAQSMRILKKRISEDHDHLFTVTLYYMLAICAKKTARSNDMIELFLAQARHSLKQVPSDVTCFSPISRIRLEREQILEEMDEFERLT